MNLITDKVGDTVELIHIYPDPDCHDASYFGHYLGDIGTVIRLSNNCIHVEVPGRISYSMQRPYVAWNPGAYRNITRSIKIDKLLNE